MGDAAVSTARGCEVIPFKSHNPPFVLEIETRRKTITGVLERFGLFEWTVMVLLGCTAAQSQTFSV